MENKAAKLFFWAVGLVFLGALMGCRENPEKGIIGEWKEVGGTQIIEFFKDGTAIVKGEEGPALSGRYTFIEANRIKMEFSGIGLLLGSVIAELSSSGEEITLTNPFGEIEKYQRVVSSENLMVPGKNMGKSIIGKWKEADDPDSPMIEFLKNGKMIVTHAESRWEPVTGKYEFIETNKIRLVLPGETDVAEILISENELILTDIDDGVELVRLLRIK